ncbi:MAG: hypothetical protein KDJ47_05935 [Hyphomicrobiaceae bacterium]|nr:hypothetical protein [Hyphomicrobiaceae bacterium]
MSDYEPSKHILKVAAEGRLWECKGLPELVRAANEAGISVKIDLGDGDSQWETVTADSVVMAVNEVDEANLSFHNPEKNSYGGMLVIPSNGDDWCCDYHAAGWLQRLVEEHTP